MLRTTKLILFIISSITLLLSATVASARPWIIDNTSVTTVDLICQDGFFAIAYDPGGGVHNVSREHHFQAHLLNGDFLQNFAITTSQQASFDEIGGFGVSGHVDSVFDPATHVERALGEQLFLHIEEQSRPLFLDFADSLFVDWYVVASQSWSESIAPGRLVAFEFWKGGVKRDRLLVKRVADCNIVQPNDLLRVSLNDAGDEGNGDALSPALSANGARIAFTSMATNLDLAVSDTAGSVDIFLNTLTTGRTQQLSFLDMRTGAIAAGGSKQADVSYDGDRVVFGSTAAIISGTACAEDDDQQSDIYQWTWRQTSHHQLISVYDPPNAPECASLGGANIGAAINESTVVFTSRSNLTSPSNGNVQDANNRTDVVVKFPASDSVVASAGEAVDGVHSTGDAGSQDATISHGGRVAFETWATDLVATDNGIAASDIILVDPDLLSGNRVANPHILISVSSAGVQGNDDSKRPAISADSQHIAFDSLATNLHATSTPADTRQVYVRDLVQNCTLLLSQSAQNLIGDGDSTDATISADGRFIAFQSNATNLVPDDTNGVSDIFLIDRDADNDGDFFAAPTGCQPDTTSIQRVSMGHDGSEANGASFDPDLAAYGTWLAFASSADNLVVGDTNSADDIFTLFLGYQTTSDSSTVLAVEAHNIVSENRFSQGMLIAALFVILLTMRFTRTMANQ